MSLAQALLPEFEQELNGMRRALERLPEDKMEWKPDPKSMSLGQLAIHLAEMPSWTAMAVNTDELDFAKGAYTPKIVNSRAELLALFDKNATEARAALASVSDVELMKPWSLRAGPQIYFTMSKMAVIRSMVLNHCIHHRGQLTVYYRMNGVPVPALYGPSADEPTFGGPEAAAGA